MNDLNAKKIGLGRLAVALVAVSGVSWAEDRSFDGTGNASADLGAAEKPFLRLVAAEYGDGLSTLAGASRPNPRVISNVLCDQAGSIPNTRLGSDFVWQWGQFIDHDITLVPGASGEDASITISDMADMLFPFIPLQRSVFENDGANVRQQVNMTTSFIDASMVYGSSHERADALRTFSGGLMKTAAGNLLPFNVDELENDNNGPFAPTELRIAGDVRSNEQPGLTAMHTLFVREHNRLAADIAVAHPDWTDEQIYQRARKWVGAIIQSITYREWLPTLLGLAAPDVDSFVYDSSVEPSVSNEFATALFRVGHTMVTTKLMRIQNDNFLNATPQNALKDAFFNPSLLATTEDIDYYLKGLSCQLHQNVDLSVNSDLRNTLFGPAGSGGLDLAALNIQRGREHGLAGYNEGRVAQGLAAATSWEDVTSDSELQAQLASLYSSVDDCDLWIGALAEDHISGASMGELMVEGFVQEFTRLSKGDAFFYLWDGDFSAVDKAEISMTTLADVIERNTGLTLLQDNVFLIPEVEGIKVNAIGIDSSTGVTLSFMAHPDSSYQLQFNNGLSDAWLDDLMPTPINTEDTVYMLTCEDSGALGAKRFYRVLRMGL